MPRTAVPPSLRADPAMRTWLALIAAAANRQTLPDDALAQRARVRSERALDRLLAQLGAFCAAFRLPPLPILVVRAGAGTPRAAAAADDAPAGREAVFAFDWSAVRPPTEQEVAATATPGARPKRGRAAAPKRRRTAPPRVHAADEIPDEERTRNSGDDAAAARELGAEGAPPLPRSRAAAAPWRVARALLALREQMNQRAPNRKKRFDGTIGDAAHAARTSDHNPWVRDGGTGVVTALDITHDPAGGCDAAALAQAIVASRDARVKYVIWNRRIANAAAIAGAAPWSWRPYGGANPHDKHVHVSVQPQKAAYDATRPWAV